MKGVGAGPHLAGPLGLGEASPPVHRHVVARPTPPAARPSGGGGGGGGGGRRRGDEAEDEDEHLEVGREWDREREGERETGRREAREGVKGCEAVGGDRISMEWRRISMTERDLNYSGMERDLNDSGSRQRGCEGWRRMRLERGGALCPGLCLGGRVTRSTEAGQPPSSGAWTALHTGGGAAVAPR